MNMMVMATAATSVCHDLWSTFSDEQFNPCQSWCPAVGQVHYNSIDKAVNQCVDKGLMAT